MVIVRSCLTGQDFVVHSIKIEEHKYLSSTTDNFNMFYKTYYLLYYPNIGYWWANNYYYKILKKGEGL